jgi:hypothetical protein
MGMEQFVAVRWCRLDGEYRRSLFFMADPNAGDDVEGLVDAISPPEARGSDWHSAEASSL